MHLHPTLFVFQQEKDLVRLKRDAKAKGSIYVPAEDKLVFVVRIRGLNHVAPKVSGEGLMIELWRFVGGAFVELGGYVTDEDELCFQERM